MFIKELILIIATILTAIFTLISINPVYSVIGLIMVFVFSGSYLLFLSINFIGLSYFIIYVGAISILFLFAVMMLDTKYPEFSSIFSSISYTKHLPLAGITIAGVIILYILYNNANLADNNLNYFNEYLSNIENTTHPQEL
jgi:NADH-ubiquinone oxidoreductase chain 6